MQGNLNELRQQNATATPIAAGASLDHEPAQSQQPPPTDETAARPATQNGPSAQSNNVDGYTGPPTSLSFESSPGEETRQPAVNYTLNLSLARRHLQEQSADIETIDLADGTRTANGSRPGSPDASSLSDVSTSAMDPLWLIDKREALRLVYVYEEEIGISYPFLVLEDLIDKTHKLYDAMEAGFNSGFPASTVPGPMVIETNDLNILRMAFSTALTIETSGSSALGKALFVKAREAALRKLWEPPTVKGIGVYTLLVRDT